MKSPRHTLSVKDTEARTAVCAVCGPVKLAKSGKGFVCRNKAAQHKREWAAANPEKMGPTRGKRSEHRLTFRDEFRQLADCSVCGNVTAVPWGRGYACANRAAELGRAIDPDAKPTEQCIVCRHFSRHDNPVKDGRCLYHFVGWEFANRPTAALVYDDETSRVVTLNTYEDRAGKVDNQSAVRGWKTLGEDVPKDEWAKWSQLLASEGL